MAKLDDALSRRTLTYLEAVARRRWPTIGTPPSELAAEAIADITAWVARQPAPPTEEVVRRVATVILRRRAADALRDQVHRYASSQPPDTLPDPAVPLPRRLVVAQALRVTLAYLSGLSSVDRRLLLRREDDRVVALTGAERKRLERLRAELRAVLRRELGLTLEELTEDQ